MIKIEIDNPKLEEHIARLIASQDSGAQKPLHQLPREALVNLHREIDAILSGGVPTPQHVADPSGQIVLMPTANPHRREFAILIDGAVVGTGEHYPDRSARVLTGPANLQGLCATHLAELPSMIRTALAPIPIGGPFSIVPAKDPMGPSRKFSVMQHNRLIAVGNVNLDGSHQITAGADALVGLCKSTAADLAKHVRAIADPTIEQRGQSHRVQDELAVSHGWRQSAGRRALSNAACTPSVHPRETRASIARARSTASAGSSAGSSAASSPARASVRGPAPPAAPTPYESRYGDLDSLISEGAAAWQALLSTWIQNWGVDGAPQPDRTEALMTAFGAYAKEVGAYVRERGGLGGACIDTLVNARMVPADDAVPTGKRLALNIVQVGTALGIPLDKLVEASLITETGKLSAKPPTPGMVQDLLDDRDRPPELGDTRV